MTFLLVALLGTLQQCVLASSVSVSIQALAAPNNGLQPASFGGAGWPLQDETRAAGKAFAQAGAGSAEGEGPLSLPAAPTSQELRESPGDETTRMQGA